MSLPGTSASVHTHQLARTSNYHCDWYHLQRKQFVLAKSPAHAHARLAYHSDRQRTSAAMRPFSFHRSKAFDSRSGMGLSSPISDRFALHLQSTGRKYRRNWRRLNGWAEQLPSTLGTGHLSSVTGGDYGGDAFHSPCPLLSECRL